MENSNIGNVVTNNDVTNHRRRRNPSAAILTRGTGAMTETQTNKIEAIWREIKKSHASEKHLTGTLSKIEQFVNGGLISVVDYKGQRIIIPLNEMMLDLPRPEREKDDEYNMRAARILNRMMGSEIDFVVKGVTETDNDSVAVASRKDAMMLLRQRYYFPNEGNRKPQIYPERIVEARIIAVSQMAIRVEIFGVETSIRNSDLTWSYIGDCRNEYFVGDYVQVRVNNIEGNTPKTLKIKADIKSLTKNDVREKLMALQPQTNCMGKVTDINYGRIYINLSDGLRAIAHKCFDHRKPGRGDDVLFVCTKIDMEASVAIGIVSRIVKRNI